MAQQLTPTWCGLCHARCGLLLEVEDGRAVGVRGDPEHPANRGQTCRRGRMMLEHLYHPDRLDHPLKRVGERGSGQWRRVSWAAALDDIAGRLDRLRELNGAETLAFARGTYRTYHWDARRFLNLFGSPNTTGANSICHCPSVTVDNAILGTSPRPDLGHAACIVIWGACRSITGQLSDWPLIREARERGARLITVDPRRTPEAEISEEWLQIRPGTDAVLMLAWIQVMIEEDLVDHDFVARQTVGFEQIRELAMSYPPRRAAELTWLPEEQIVVAARLYATTRPAAIRGGQGLDKSGPAFKAAAHALAVLRAISGNLDVIGGERLGGADPPPAVISNLQMERNEALPEAQRAKLLGRRQYPLFSFDAWQRVADQSSRSSTPSIRPYDAAEIVVAHPHAVYSAMLTGEPYPVRALICQAANPLLTLADPRRTEQALRNLDLLVVMDPYLTPTAHLADYVLPAACTVERDDLAVFGSGCIAYPKGVEPLGERRSDYELWMELGRRLGQEAEWPWQSMAEVNDFRLAPAGLSFADLAERRALFFEASTAGVREHGFPTPSGKVELVSSLMAELGCDPLPTPRAPGPQPDDRFPLLLITGNGFDPMYNSEQRQWPSARRLCPDPLVTLHPQTAASLGLEAGEWVRIETADGAVRQRLSLSDSIHPRTVDGQHGWWFPEEGAGSQEPFGYLRSNINALVSDDAERCSEGTGGWLQAAIPCRIVRDLDS